MSNHGTNIHRFFVPASSPSLLLLQLPSPQSSFSFMMIHHTTRSSLSHQRYYIVEFILVLPRDRRNAFMLRLFHVPASSELMPLDHYDTHILPSQSIYRLIFALCLSIIVPYDRGLIGIIHHHPDCPNDQYWCWLHLPLSDTPLFTQRQQLAFFTVIIFSYTALQEIATGGSHTTLDYRYIGVLTEWISVQYSST
jgi:hypothetical protein